MEVPFVYFNNYEAYGSKQVGYSIASSSNFYSDKNQKLQKIIEDIQESDVCIIDITPIDFNKNLPLLVGQVLVICIEQNKKVILIHHQEVKEDYLSLITSHIKKENLLGLFPYDGKQFPEQVMICLDNHYAKDSKYDRHSSIVLDSGANANFLEILNQWVQEKELGGNCFYHIYSNIDNIEIHYEGYNTSVLCTLTIGVSKLDISDRLNLESQIIKCAQDAPGRIFVHGSICMNEAWKHQRKI